MAPSTLTICRPRPTSPARPTSPDAADQPHAADRHPRTDPSPADDADSHQTDAHEANDADAAERPSRAETADPPDDPVAARAALALSRSDADRRVARVLLRCGNVLAARVHLETLAGRDALDLAGVADLAEARWRTGDLAGAGEAAAAHLDAGGTEPIAYVVGAEAMSAEGRPTEARRLARHALDGLRSPLDAVFAGQRRSSIWPDDAAAAAQPAGTLFAAGPRDAAHGGRIGLTATTGASRPSAAATAATAATSADGTAPGASRATAGAAAAARDAASDDQPWPDGGRSADSLWDSDWAEAAPATGAAPTRGEEDDTLTAAGPSDDLDAARRALDADDRQLAAVRLAIVLRTRPALAPAVLDLVGDAPGPEFDLIRGDALRLVGHEAAAERAFESAARALTEPTTRSPE